MMPTQPAHVALKSRFHRFASPKPKTRARVPQVTLTRAIACPHHPLLAKALK